MAHWSGLVAKSLTASTLLWASSAAAVDGVIEINQAKADAGAVNGSLVSDPAGFPVVITQPGSYRLTGNLTVPDSNTTAIEVGSGYVDIDLNGFAILGPNVCASVETPCTANGSGLGIHAPSPSTVDVRVHDGTVRGMGASGVALQAFAQVSRVNAQWNGGAGIFVADDSIVTANRVVLNGGAGILTFSRSAVLDNVVASNGQNGITTREFSHIARNIVTGNGAAGSCGIDGNDAISAALSSASQNTVSDNPSGCPGGICCSLVDAQLLDCNLLTGVAIFGPQRCCPDPPNADICY
jgi:hypothetical protein